MASGDAVLVADIGGTNARFALMNGAGEVIRADTLSVAAYPNFTDALEAFLAAGPERPHRAGFAVAGPVTAGRADFTNSPWTIDGPALRLSQGLEACLVLNDFRALGAYALVAPSDDLMPIKSGTPVSGAPVVIIGPGTGLGQSLAVPAGDRVLTVAAEGGHVVLGASTPEEADLLDIMGVEIGRPVTGEDVVSGRGLERLHRAHLKLLGREGAEASAAEITEGAENGQPVYMATVEQFLLFLGTLASNAALSTGARGGVLLAGGILPRIADVIPTSGFAQRFVGKSPMADYLSAIPVNLTLAPDAALRGVFNALKEIPAA